MKAPVAWTVLFMAGIFVESIWPETPSGATTGLSMKAAAEQAMAVSPELRGEAAQQVLKEGSWVLGFRSFLPILSLTASENDRLSTIGADSFTKNYTISIQQLLWDGGRLAANRNLEKAELDLGRMDLRRKSAETGESAINLYRTIIYNEALLHIKEESLKALELQGDILREEVRRGLALQTDLDEADLSLESSRLDVESLRLDMDMARLELADLLGLKELPSLSERIDTGRSTVLPRSGKDDLITLLGQMVLEVHPDLVRERYAIRKLQVQLQSASRAWWPTFRLSGDLSLQGDRYPLSRYNYSLGLMMEFSSPYLSGSVGGKAGWEGSSDRTAALQSSAEPVPDPASALSRRSLEAMLALEQERYGLLLRQMESQCRRLVQSCFVAEDKRLLARRQMELSRKQLELQEVKHSLGQSTTLDVMKARIEASQQETAVVEAAVSLLQAERELEKYLDLSPGELGLFIQTVRGNQP